MFFADCDLGHSYVQAARRYPVFVMQTVTSLLTVISEGGISHMHYYEAIVLGF